MLKQQEFEHKQLVDERQFRVTVVSLAATIIATIALFLNYYLGQHNSRLEGKRLTFERFTKAIEQLAGKQGANDEDDRTIRIGAIYTLEGVAKDDPELNWTVMQTLASYVRRRSPLPRDIRDIFEFDGANRTYRLTDQEIEEKPRSLDPTTDDIQVALDVLSKTYQTNGMELEHDLSRSNLSRACFLEANLSGANCFRTIFYSANFNSGNLSGAYLHQVVLTRVSLIDANLSGANLLEANLIKADLSGANLTSVQNFETAIFTGAKFNSKPLPVDWQTEPLPPTQLPFSTQEALAQGMIDLTPDLVEPIPPQTNSPDT